MVGGSVGLDVNLQDVYTAPDEWEEVLQRHGEVQREVVFPLTHLCRSA